VLYLCALVKKGLALCWFCCFIAPSYKSQSSRESSEQRPSYFLNRNCALHRSSCCLLSLLLLLLDTAAALLLRSLLLSLPSQLLLPLPSAVAVAAVAAAAANYMHNHTACGDLSVWHCIHRLCSRVQCSSSILCSPALPRSAAALR
jgi:hypothetical protein